MSSAKWTSRARAESRVVPEASFDRTDAGLAPRGDGWFVLNARDARWRSGAFGIYTPFEDEQRFEQVGVNIAVLEPGQANCMYHGEDAQEDFLVLSGECLLLIEGEERPLEAWDFVHCPPGTEHVFVGAGSRPCLLLGVGSRTGGSVVYPRSELALKYGAGVERETTNPAEAYGPYPRDEDVQFREEWLRV